MQRTEVPDWAGGPRQEQKVPGPSTEQRKLILKLLDEKEMTDEQRQWVLDHIDTLTPGRAGKASEVITRLLRLPRKKAPMSARDVVAMEVPAGRYAVDSDEGELRFYKLWRHATNPDAWVLYVLHGPDQSKMYRGAAIGVLNKISKAGIREAAIRFGNEIGACSNCGRRLTNRISRELGIGPICGGRMFGEDDFRDEVKAARQAIIDRGEDPDEDIYE